MDGRSPRGAGPPSPRHVSAIEGESPRRRAGPELGVLSPRGAQVPLASPGEDVVAPSQFCGFLLKRGPTKKHDYKLRWCHADTTWLKYYKSQKDTKPLGMICLRDVRSFWPVGNGNPPPSNVSSALVFCMIMSEVAGGREFVFAAMSEDTKATWVSVLERNIEAQRPAPQAREPASFENDFRRTATQSNPSVGNWRELPSAPPPKGPVSATADDEELSGYAEELLRQIEENAMLENDDEDGETASVTKASEDDVDALVVVCRCVRQFVPTDRTQQLEAKVGDMFSVIETVNEEWLLVRRLDRDEMGMVPQSSVKKV